MKSKQPKKIPPIPAKFLLKRWEEYGITKEEIFWLINEGYFTAYDRNHDFYEKAKELELWLHRSVDSIIDDVSFDLSEIEESEEEILRALRPHKFKPKVEEKKDVAEPEPDEEPQQVSEPERKLERWEKVAIYLRTEEKLSKSQICKRLERVNLKHSDLRTCQRHLAALFKSENLNPADKKGRPKKAK